MAFTTIDNSDFAKNGVLMMLLPWNNAQYNASSIIWASFGCYYWYRVEGGCDVKVTGCLGVSGHIAKTVAKSLLSAIGRITLLPLNLLAMFIGMLVLVVGVAVMHLTFHLCTSSTST